jgi:hypothetical protein
VERRHGVDDTASSIDGIGPEPSPNQINSIDDLDSISSSCTTDDASTDTLVASTACAADDAIDFRASRHPRASRASRTNPSTTNASLIIYGSHNTID